MLQRLLDVVYQRNAPDALITREAQLGVMAGVTLVVLAVGSASLRWGYDPSHRNPELFWIVEAFVVVLAAGLGFFERIKRAFQIVVLGQDQNDPEAIDKWKTAEAKWARRRLNWGGWWVVAAVAANIFALEQLVAKTGQGLASPFAPLLTGPALFGAFVAQSAAGLVPLILASAGVIVWLDLKAPRESAAQPPPPADQSACATVTPVPDSATYAVVAISLLLVAGLVSAFRIKRAQKLSKPPNGNGDGRWNGNDNGSDNDDDN